MFYGQIVMSSGIKKKQKKIVFQRQDLLPNGFFATRRDKTPGNFLKNNSASKGQMIKKYFAERKERSCLILKNCRVRSYVAAKHSLSRIKIAGRAHACTRSRARGSRAKIFLLFDVKTARARTADTRAHACAAKMLAENGEAWTMLEKPTLGQPHMRPASAATWVKQAYIYHRKLLRITRLDLPQYITPLLRNFNLFPVV